MRALRIKPSNKNLDGFGQVQRPAYDLKCLFFNPVVDPVVFGSDNLESLKIPALGPGFV